ncbi:hypothetical protein CMO94_04285 [Candidatus Woesearchaeota archaeon]|nr:hypothetical protein [Candidatus Woesearchaeota archaeon]
MLKNKKSQGLSITTIILAVIGLMILVVIIALLTGRLGGFSKGVLESGDCSSACQAAGYDGGDKAGSDQGILDSEGNECLCANEDTSGT